MKKVTILFGTETGTAEELAFQVFNRLRNTLNVEIYDLDIYDVTKLPDEDKVIFIVSTTGDGEVPSTMKDFWKFLLRKSLPSTSLSSVSVAIFGLGDSSYEKYNLTSRKLSKRLLSLGCIEILPLSFGDDQSKFGCLTTFEPWLSKLESTLLSFPPLASQSPILHNDSNYYDIETVSMLSSSEFMFIPPRTPKQIIHPHSIQPAPLNTVVHSTSLCNSLIESTVLSTNRLTSLEWNQTVKHLTLSLPHSSPSSPSSSPRFLFSAGDVAAIYPSTPPSSLPRIMSLMHQLNCLPSPSCLSSSPSSLSSSPSNLSSPFDDSISLRISRSTHNLHSTPSSSSPLSSLLPLPRSRLLGDGGLVFKPPSSSSSFSSLSIQCTLSELFTIYLDFSAIPQSSFFRALSESVYFPIPTPPLSTSTIASSSSSTSSLLPRKELMENTISNFKSTLSQFSSLHFSTIMSMTNENTPTITTITPTITTYFKPLLSYLEFQLENYEKLIEFSLKEGLDLYYDYCLREKRSYLEVMEDFKQCLLPPSIELQSLFLQWIDLIDFVSKSELILESLSSPPSSSTSSPPIPLPVDHSSPNNNNNNNNNNNRINNNYNNNNEIEEAFSSRFSSHHCPLTLSRLLTLIPAHRPRFYSIASSCLANPNQVELCVSLVSTRTRLGRQRQGLCSSYLTSLRPGDKVRMFLCRTSTSLQLSKQQSNLTCSQIESFLPLISYMKNNLPPLQSPFSSSFSFSSFILSFQSLISSLILRPLLLVGPGTGVACMRALLQERTELIKMIENLLLFFSQSNIQSINIDTPPPLPPPSIICQLLVDSLAHRIGKIVLFFGCRKRSEDFLYGNEWHQHHIQWTQTNTTNHNNNNDNDNKNPSDIQPSPEGIVLISSSSSSSLLSQSHSYSSGLWESAGEMGIGWGGGNRTSPSFSTSTLSCHITTITAFSRDPILLLEPTSLSSLASLASLGDPSPSPPLDPSISSSSSSSSSSPQTNYVTDKIRSHSSLILQLLLVPPPHPQTTTNFSFGQETLLPSPPTLPSLPLPALILISGSAKRMPQDVKKAIHDALMKGMGTIDQKPFSLSSFSTSSSSSSSLSSISLNNPQSEVMRIWNQLEKEGRLILDVWS